MCKGRLKQKKFTQANSDFIHQIFSVDKAERRVGIRLANCPKLPPSLFSHKKFTLHFRFYREGRSSFYELLLLLFDLVVDALVRILVMWVRIIVLSTTTIRTTQQICGFKAKPQ
jgi:hypothetical protein